MAVKITIIGLGQIGASIGLALAPHKDLLVITGHDKDFGIERRSKKLGAVHETDHNLPNSVENADLVILALPVHEIRETLVHIAKDLRNDAVIVDTSLVKVKVAKWAKEILPETVHYVGIAPAVGPKYLDLRETGLDSAKADLFEKSVFLLSAPSGTPEQAVKLVSDLIGFLGATTLLTDFVESDGLMATTHLLPWLTSTALLNASTSQPGWMEMRKSASQDYFNATAAFSEGKSAQALAELAMHNRENVIRTLNALMNALLDLREDLEKAEEASLLKRLETAQQNRLNWLLERERAEWTKMPGAIVEKQTMMESLFGSKFGKMGKRKE
ncbi:MAG: prephenate dehydrogenase [Anaerolineales bacterium]|uniref:prephenate dehydrogenase n=1 Tax=Candidatus Villigracilis vicinus TaxID=3140679 RepID=UPI00313740C8|nr:prephenate dehydrogenase [Anaerolineales bacterium]MBK7450027.1 prephenate dehydrogenase [Anaerolineales bacterium]MBK9779727.1 prephenate dehydrogenase [Anaerolineales bacterium]